MGSILWSHGHLPATKSSRGSIGEEMHVFFAFSSLTGRGKQAGFTQRWVRLAFLGHCHSSQVCPKFLIHTHQLVHLCEKGHASRVPNWRRASRPRRGTVLLRTTIANGVLRH